MKAWTSLRRQGAGSPLLIKRVKKYRRKQRRQVPLGDEAIFEKRSGERWL